MRKITLILVLTMLCGTSSFAQVDSSLYNNTTQSDKQLPAKRIPGTKYGTDIAFSSGIWSPNRRLVILGQHPYIGLRIGSRTGKVIFDFALDLKFVRSRNQYKVLKYDSLYCTNDFKGIYIGINAGYKLFKTGKTEFEVLGGIGYDNINVLHIKGEPRDIVQLVESINLNTGLGYRIFLHNSFRNGTHRYSYLSIEAKYNFIDYNNRGGTDLAGNAFTIGILYGGIVRRDPI